jgi:tetratricopeptide (TPR) repeat protein/two-component sensor histidine kinase
MAFRFILFCFFIAPLLCVAQPAAKQEDSLLHVLQQHKTKDTARVKLLLNYIKDNFLTHPDSSLLEYANEALEISETLNWSKGIAMSYQRLGIVYDYVIPDLPTALSSYQKAIKANEAAKIKNFNWQMYSNIGIIYQDNKLFRKAANYQLLSLAKAKDENVTEKELMQLYINIGNPYAEMKMNDSALYYFEKANALQDEKTNLLSRFAVLSGAGFCYAMKSDFIKAKEYLEKAIELAKANNFSFGIGLASNNIAQTYLKMKEPALAEKYAKDALALVEQNPAAIWPAMALQTLSGAYNMQGKYKEAYEALNRSYLLMDSTINEVTDEKLSFAESQFEYEKKEAVLNATHHAELKQQQTVKYAVIGGTGLLLLGGVFGLFFYKRKRDAQARLKEAELKAEITDTELKVMRLQMNPHFIFNSLNSIGDYIAKNNPKEADDYLSKFAKVMRMTLENSERQAIPLSDDLKALELYMQLEAKRLNNKFTYEIKVTGDIDKDNTLVPPMIFQPFVENSIWHGIAKKEGQGHIVIDISKEGEMLNCRIDDDGVGRKQAEFLKVQQEDKKQSLGMRITKARIDILNKLKGSNATVQLVDKPQGVTAELKLPVETNF